MYKINSNPIYRLFIPKFLRTIIWKNYLKKKILSSYKNSQDKEIIELISSIKERGLHIISSKLKGHYDQDKINVNYDPQRKMKYVNFDNEKISIKEFKPGKILPSKNEESSLLKFKQEFEKLIK